MYKNCISPSLSSQRLFDHTQLLEYLLDFFSINGTKHNQQQNNNTSNIDMAVTPENSYFNLLLRFLYFGMFFDFRDRKTHAKINMRRGKNVFSSVMKLKNVILAYILFSIPGKVLAIANGKVVDFPGKYPHVVNADLCTAVLVSPNLAIGVAHCCHNKLLVGAHNISEIEVGQEEFEVTETVFATGIRLPRKFVYGLNHYDIVLLRFNGFSKYPPIDINDVAPPVMSIENLPESEQMDLLLTGWGSQIHGDVKSEILKESKLDLIPILDCKKIYNKRIELWYGGGRRDLVCALKTVNGKSSGPCTGDDGAPLINLKNGKLVGIVTIPFLPACGDEDYPGVFTNVYYYKDWIEFYIEKFSCPWFKTIKYPTSAPTFTKIPTISPSTVASMTPSVPPSIKPTTVPTEIPTTHPLIVPTKGPSKKKLSTTEGPIMKKTAKGKKLLNPTKAPTPFPTKGAKGKKFLNPTKAPTPFPTKTVKGKKSNAIKVPPKNNPKKSKSEGSQSKNAVPDPSDCHWTRDVVQETLENVIEEEATEDTIVKIETISQRVVYRRSCYKSSSRLNISSIVSTVKSFFPASIRNVFPNNFDPQSGTESEDTQNQLSSDDPSVKQSENTEEPSEIPTEAS